MYNLNRSVYTQILQIRAAASQVAPTSYNTPFAGCATAGSGRNGVVRVRILLYPLTPAAVNALGLGLQGLQFDYNTPRTYSANMTVQYSVTTLFRQRRRMSTPTGRDLQGGVGYQNVTQILPAGISTGKGCPYATFAENSCVPFVDFGGGSYQATYGVSSYHGLQTKLEAAVLKRIDLARSRTPGRRPMSDAGDLLNGGSTGGLRAYNVPGLGPKFDYALRRFRPPQRDPLQRRI